MDDDGDDDDDREDYDLLLINEMTTVWFGLLPLSLVFMHSIPGTR